MSRLIKCRRVCVEPQCRVFTPDVLTDATVNLSVVELEAMRLCDLENLDQDCAAERMQVSRGTLQRILYAARLKVADALTNAKQVVIEGGNYQLAQVHCQSEKICRNCKFMSSQKKEM